MSMTPENTPSPDARPNLPEFSVTELSGAVKRTVEEAFGYVRVRGEISRPAFPGSGHCYLRLKDEKAVLDSVVWRGTLSRLSIKPEDGLEVIATGRLTTFPGKSTYQLVIERMEVAGEGALLKLLEERRKKLAAEGLFAEERKRPLPFLPEVIGVVTSPTGAVIRDILHRIADRFPRDVLVWPVRVQGDGAAEEIAAAIRGFNDLTHDGEVIRPDVLIVARGGGSLEDLWAFNEEIVVRAAADSDIPLISAVGHETDTTLIDFASDRRAPTPTAAAEMAVPVRGELLAQILDDAQRLTAAAVRIVSDRRTQLQGFARGIGRPESILAEKSQRLDSWAERLGMTAKTRLDRARDTLSRLAPPHPAAQLRTAKASFDTVADRLNPALERQLKDQSRHLASVPDLTRPMTELLNRKQQRTEAASRLIESFSYKNVLKRGFAVVRDDSGSPLTDAASVAEGAALHLEFHDGRAEAVGGLMSRGKAPTETAHGKATEPQSTTARKTKTQSPGGHSASKKPSSQGSLF